MQYAIRCLNCRQETGSPQAFMEMVLCPECSSVATRLEQRATEQLRWLRTLYLEWLKSTIVEGKLALTQVEVSSQPGKKDVLEQILRFSERMDEHARSTARAAEQSALSK
jgi:hypothetical protein